MKLRKKIRNWLHYLLWGVIVASAGLLLGSAGTEQNGSRCRKVSVRMDYGQSESLMTEADVEKVIWETAGQVTGKSLGNINTEVIEKAVKRLPYVSGVRVYETLSGTLMVEVNQHQPVIRVITNDHHSFYIGNRGAILPFQPDYPVRLPVATGFIFDSVCFNPPVKAAPRPTDTVGLTGILSDLFMLGWYISNTPFFKAQIDQIYVNPSGEFELIPRIGDQVILFGTTEDLPDKFNRLLAFYKFGLNQTGWNKYNLINIKYKNQVVCSNI